MPTASTAWAANSSSISRPIYVNQDAIPVEAGSAAQLATVRSATAANLLVKTRPELKISNTQPLTAQAPNPTPTTPTAQPTPTPTPTPKVPTPSNGTQAQPLAEPEPRVLVLEVVITGATGQLEDEIFRVISTRAGQATTRSQLQADVKAIFATGYFASVDVKPEDTPLGVRVTFLVQPNPVLRNVTVNVVPEGVGKRVLPQQVVDNIFNPQYGQILNLRQLQEGIKKLNQWYKDNGYDLAQVVDASKVNFDGTVTLVVAEGVVEDIRVRFLNKEGQPTNDQGEPIRGRTRPFIITREVQLKSGDLFNRRIVERDLRRVFGLGIFNDVRLSFAPGTDPRRVIVVVDVIEKNTGMLAAGLGVSSKTGFFGEISFRQLNLYGKAQRLNFEGQIGMSGLNTWASITSPGLVNREQQDSLSNVGFSALSALNSENGYSRAIEQLLNVLEIAKRENRKVEYALTFNNLGNIYSTIENYSSAIDAYQQARGLFHELNSPVLELLMSIRLSALYKENGQPEQAILNYYKALNTISKLQGKRKIEIIIGKKVSKILSEEWQVGDELDDNFDSILLLLKTTILLDIGATYTALGDYQQALYIINSPELVHSNQILTEKIKGLLDSLAAEHLENIDFKFKNLDPITEQELKSSLLESLESLKSKILSFVTHSNDLEKLLALQFIYADLNEQSLAFLYQTEYRQKFSGIANYLQTSISRAASLARKHINLFNIKDERLKDSIVRASEILEKWLAYDRSTNPDATINQEELKKDIEPLVNSLIDYLLTSENFKNIGLTSEEVEAFIPIFKSAIPLVVNLFISSDNSDALVNLSEEILNNWPTDHRLLGKYEWAKGFIYYILGQQYYKRGEYQKSANSYSYSIMYENAASTFLENFFATNRLEQIDSVISSQVGKLESFFERENAGPSGKILTSLLINYRSLILYFIKTSLISSSKEAANSYLEINEPLKAKMLYQKVLLLKEELSKNYPSISRKLGEIVKEGELSEIYYGIARADFMLGNFNEAQDNIEKAIRITETFIPLEFLSGTSGFTQISMQYGYGFPNQGSLSVTFSATPSNPWVIPWSSEKVTKYYELRNRLNHSVSINSNSPTDISPSDISSSDYIPSCSTIVDYFACRQNYFELYIAILTKRHQQFPSAQFDILAFEQSERARTRSMQVLANLNDPLVNYKNLSSSQQRLVKRKIRLNQSASLNTIRQEVIDEDTLLLEYFLGEKTSYLWVISKHGELQTFELPPRSEIESKAKEFYNLLTTPSGRVRPQTTAKVGKELSRIILGPISNQLQEKRLVVVGDGFLQYLPFNVLPDPTSNDVFPKTDSQGEFAPYLEPLMLKHEIISLPSASSLVALRQDRLSRPEPEQELAIFADPIFNHEDRRVRRLKIGNGDFQPFRIENLRNVDILYGSLPNTSRELSRAFRIIPRSQRRSYLGFNANLRNALDPDLGHFRIVHFASHGIFNSQSPQRSGIVLSSINEQGELQPSLLSAAYAFRKMDLSATELVVLSGCRTGFGIGDVAREGLTGFTGGLLSAGTDRVVASLWSVQDEATRELMSRFYERMLDRDNPMTPAQALRAAQISMWEEPRWQTPYYWAAFIIQGEWK